MEPYFFIHCFFVRPCILPLCKNIKGPLCYISCWFWNRFFQEFFFFIVSFLFYEVSLRRHFPPTFWDPRQRRMKTEGKKHAFKITILFLKSTCLSCMLISFLHKSAIVLIPKGHAFERMFLKTFKKLPAACIMRSKNSRLRLEFLKLWSIGHFIVVCFVTCPLRGSEAGGDLVLIQTVLLFTCRSCCSHAN